MQGRGGLSRSWGLEQIREDSQENAESTYVASQALNNFSARHKGHAPVAATPLKSSRNQPSTSAIREPVVKRGGDQEKTAENQQHRKRYPPSGDAAQSTKLQPREMVTNYSMPSSPAVSDRAPC